jgi:hypothetical protein
MQKIYLIQYKVPNEISMESRIKSVATNWFKYFENNWLIVSTLSSKELYEKISIGFDENSILIIEVNAKNYYGRMNTKVWDWLKQRK